MAFVSLLAPILFPIAVCHPFEQLLSAYLHLFYSLLLHDIHLNSYCQPTCNCSIHYCSASSFPTAPVSLPVFLLPTLLSTLWAVWKGNHTDLQKPYWESTIYVSLIFMFHSLYKCKVRKLISSFVILLDVTVHTTTSVIVECISNTFVC